MGLPTPYPLARLARNKRSSSDVILDSKSDLTAFQSGIGVLIFERAALTGWAVSALAED
jgi:hypothetical protein